MNSGVLESYTGDFPPDFNEVILKRLQLALLRLEQLEARVSKLERGLARLQFSMERSK